MADKKVTVIDLAHAAGVSKSTVSLVLQGSPLVKDETRARVTRAMADLGYVYNRGAANLRQARSTIVGIIVNDLTNSVFAELAVGVDAIVQSAGYVQFMGHSAEDVQRQSELIASMREHGVAGLIISPARGTEAADLKPVVDSFHRIQTDKVFAVAETLVQKDEKPISLEDFQKMQAEHKH